MAYFIDDIQILSSLSLLKILRFSGRPFDFPHLRFGFLDFLYLFDFLCNSLGGLDIFDSVSLLNILIFSNELLELDLFFKSVKFNPIGNEPPSVVAPVGTELIILVFLPVFLVDLR